MRNPNGYGCVYKLSGKRRKPYAVRVTDHWERDEETGATRQKYKTLGTYATRAEAFSALTAYHADPHAIPSAATFSEIFDKWSAEKYQKVSQSAIDGYNLAYKHCATLYDLKFVDLRKAHMQSVIDKCPLGFHSKEKIKVLFNQLYKYSLENDLVSKDYSRFVELGANTKESTRRPFSDPEIQFLWKHCDHVPNADLILIMIYSGWRIGELLELENSNVNLEDWTFRGGKKTAAGKNRLVPIHTRIRPFIESRYDPNEKYLVRRSDIRNKPITHAHFTESMFKPALDLCGILSHVPHDCRHTCATLMDNAGANRTSIKRILGHASTDVTESVYTHKDIEELRRAIELIP